MSLRVRLMVILGIGATLLLAACGATDASSSATTPAGYGAPTATSAPTGGGAAQIATASVSVKGTTKTVLTDAASGKTLYYRTDDTATTSQCNSGCLTIWPPEATTGTPTSTASLSGPLTAFTGNGGQQAEYNGHPLYMYGGDSAAGQANGDGIGGIWFVVTPDLKAQTTPTGGSGYGR